MTDTTIITQPNAQAMYDAVCAKLKQAYADLATLQAKEADKADQVRQLEAARDGLEAFYTGLFQTKPKALA